MIGIDKHNQVSISNLDLINLMKGGSGINPTRSITNIESEIQRQLSLPFVETTLNHLADINFFLKELTILLLKDDIIDNSYFKRKLNKINELFNDISNISANNSNKLLITNKDNYKGVLQLIYNHYITFLYALNAKKYLEAPRNTTPIRPIENENGKIIHSAITLIQRIGNSIIQLYNNQLVLHPQLDEKKYPELDIQLKYEYNY